jgi:hypothetical protein
MATPSRRSTTSKSTPGAATGTASKKPETEKRAPQAVGVADGVIINELLCFICNKMDILPHDTIVKLCIDVFTDQEVEDAKAMLRDSCEMETNGRVIWRKGADKTKNNLNDILNFLHGAEPDVIPCFVARDLSKLPPIHYNHMDMSILLKELEIVKGDIADLKIAQLATLEICREQPKSEVTGDCTMRTVTPTVPCASRTSETGSDTDADQESRGSCVIVDVSTTTRGQSASSDGESATGDCSISNYTVDAGDDPEREEGELDDSLTELKQPTSTAGVMQCKGRQHADRSAPHRLNASAPSFAVLARDLSTHGMKATSRSQIDTEDGFTTVGPRKKKPVVIGTGRSTSLRGVKSTPATAAVFVTRLAPGTTEDDICDYVRSVFGVDACSEQLRTRYNTYASFKVVVKVKHIVKLMDPVLWPEEVLVRKFFVPRNTN